MLAFKGGPCGKEGTSLIRIDRGSAVYGERESLGPLLLFILVAGDDDERGLQGHQLQHASQICPPGRTVTVGAPTREERPAAVKNAPGWVMLHMVVR